MVYVSVSRLTCWLVLALRDQRILHIMPILDSLRPTGNLLASLIFALHGECEVDDIFVGNVLIECHERRLLPDKSDLLNLFLLSHSASFLLVQSRGLR